MRSVLVFSMAVSFAMLGLGLSLECYSCPDGSTNCEVKRTCNQGEDSCLKVTTTGNMTYKDCVRMSDCSAEILSLRFVVPKLEYKCCSSDLCNGKKKESTYEKLMKFFNLRP